MAKKLLTHCGSRGSFKTKTAQLAAIDGVGWCYLETQRAKLFLINNAELAFIRTNEINVAHFQGENYPERLKHCIDGSFYYLLLDKLI
jgi:DNA processing protein